MRVRSDSCFVLTCRSGDFVCFATASSVPLQHDFDVVVCCCVGMQQCAPDAVGQEGVHVGARQVYFVFQRSVWSLRPMRTSEQVAWLVSNRRFENALYLTKRDTLYVFISCPRLKLMSWLGKNSERKSQMNMRAIYGRRCGSMIRYTQHICSVWSQCVAGCRCLGGACVALCRCRILERVRTSPRFRMTVPSLLFCLTADL